MLKHIGNEINNINTDNIYEKSYIQKNEIYH